MTEEERVVTEEEEWWWYSEQLKDFASRQVYQKEGIYRLLPVMKFWNICDSTSSRIKNKLKTIKLTCRKVEK
jgi:hypothetical protein